MHGLLLAGEERADSHLGVIPTIADVDAPVNVFIGRFAIEQRK